MKTLAALIYPIVLTGCATSMADIRGREVQDNVLVPQTTVRVVRDCLVTKLAALRTPAETGTPDDLDITFSTEAAGAIFNYHLKGEAGGVRVMARRKNSIANGFNAARQCYQP